MSVKRTLSFFFFLFAIIFLIPASSQAQTSDAVADLVARINRERTTRGMLPYALSASLNAAAQAHADDIARTGVDSHTGSDGSDVRVRVKRAGYAAYSWGYRVGENWAYYFDATTAMNMWMNSTPHTKNILHQVYREFGVGIARKANGAFIYVVDFGAQPNVLPVFIQNDARDTSVGRVTIALSNETYAASGDGAQTIGLATQVEISNTPSFADAQWQSYAAKINWTLAPGNGTKTIYVKFRDARGRTVTSSDSINLSAPGTLTPPPIFTPRPRPTLTVTPLLSSLVRRGVGEEVVPSPTVISVSETTATPDAVIAQLITPEPLPTLAPDSAYDSDDGRLNFLVPGLIGVVALLVIFGIALAVKRQENKR